MGKEHGAWGIQFYQNGQQQQNGTDADGTNGSDHQVKNPFHQPVIRPSQVILEAHERHPLLVHIFHHHPIQGQANQVGHKGQVPYQGLDSVHQLVQLGRGQPRGRNKYVLDLRLLDNFRDIVEGAQVGQIPYVFLLGASIIHIAYNMKGHANVLPQPPQQQPGGFTAAYQEHRNPAHPGPFQDPGHNVPGNGRKDKGQNPEQSYKQSGSAGCNMGGIHKEDNKNDSVGTGIKHPLEHFPKGHPALVHLGMPEKQDERQRKYQVEIGPGNMKILAAHNAVSQGICTRLSQ